MLQTWWRQRTARVASALATGRIRKNALRAIPFWVASVAAGLIAVGYTKLFNYAESWQHYFWNWHHWSLFFIAPLGFLIAWILVARFAPAARGSGIPQVMAAIELASPRHSKLVGMLLSIRIAVIKILSSLFMIVGGGAIGREGPTIQISGAVFRWFSQRVPKSWPPMPLQHFLITGAASGLAGAFNTPLGGVVFAVEELAKTHFRFFRTALFSAVIIAGLTAQALAGSYLYLGYPDVSGLGFLIFLPVIMAAALSGLLGAQMCKYILRLMKWKQSFNWKKTAIYIVFAGLIMAAMANFVDASALGSGKEIMNESLFNKTQHMEWYIPIVRMLGSIFCFNVGASGGVFAPALASGASIGAWLSSIFHFSGAESHVIILAGMVGFLTGVTRTPFTSAILVLEMTDRHGVILHLMVAGLISNIAALTVDEESFYERLTHGYLKEVVQDGHVPEVTEEVVEDEPPKKS